jgi:hypothetical protein
VIIANIRPVLGGTGHHTDVPAVELDAPLIGNSSVLAGRIAIRASLYFSVISMTRLL